MDSSHAAPPHRSSCYTSGLRRADNPLDHVSQNHTLLHQIIADPPVLGRTIGVHRGLKHVAFQQALFNQGITQ